MGALVQEAVEGDDEFWGQEAWQEVRGRGFCFSTLRLSARPHQAAADDEYKSEREEADVFDSDFTDDDVRARERERGEVFSLERAG
jgi:hypothetical protein